MQNAHQVFSTSVEVFPLTKRLNVSLLGLLHVRGGVSLSIVTDGNFALSSPRPWRCFYPSSLLTKQEVVFSTSVEVFLHAGRDDQRKRGLLHVRGGVSHGPEARAKAGRSSPRPWRCFRLGKLLVVPWAVFSTSVEVFPAPASYSERRAGLLHVRGGVSSGKVPSAILITSSPRPWRCF